MVFSDWSTTTGDAIRDAGIRIANYLPNLLGAIVILIIGLVLGNLARWLVREIVRSLGVQKWFDDQAFAQTLKEAKISTNLASLIGEFVKWVIVIVFLIPAAEQIGLPQVSTILNDIIHYLPNVGVAVIIVFFGALFAEFIGGIVRATATSLGARTATALSVIARYVIYVFATLTALSELGIAAQIISIFLYGFVGALAISLGLAFGLGGQRAASDAIDKIRQEFAGKK